MSLIASSSEVSSVNSEQIKQKALALGFHKVGIAAVEAEGRGQEAEGRGQKAGEIQNYKDTKNSPSPHHPITPSPHHPITPSTHPPIHPSTHPTHPLQTWLDRGYHADMDWMENPQRQDVRSLMPTVQSVICVALNYYTAHDRPEGSEYARISRYGWGRDYHRILHKRLKALARWLEEQGEGISVRYYADTGPIQDKVWAERAGMGWIAKNSNVITREYGSWVFLGELLTNLKLMPDRPHTQHCGTCTRCIDACPTQAITQPFVVDANRCIAYHTIENRGEIPEPIAANLQGWIAGCDICQDVCPWNQRFAQATDVAEFQPYPWNIAPTLEEIAHLSDAAWQERFPASALRRIKPNMLRRNARLNSLAQMRTECVSIDTRSDNSLESF